MLSIVFATMLITFIVTNAVFKLYMSHYVKWVQERINEHYDFVNVSYNKINKELEMRFLKIKKLNMFLSENVREYYSQQRLQYEGDAGFDLYTPVSAIIAPHETFKIPLGVFCEPEDGLAYDLRCRSSIYKTPLRLCNSVGTIDANYRGELMAVVDNISDEVYHLKAGDRLFQIVSGDGRKIVPKFIDTLDELSSTDRGQAGFGSTF